MRIIGLDGLKNLIKSVKGTEDYVRSLNMTIADEWTQTLQRSPEFTALQELRSILPQLKSDKNLWKKVEDLLRILRVDSQAVKRIMTAKNADTLESDIKKWANMAEDKPVDITNVQPQSSEVRHSILHENIETAKQEQQNPELFFRTKEVMDKIKNNVRHPKSH